MQTAHIAWLCVCVHVHCPSIDLYYNQYDVDIAMYDGRLTLAPEEHQNHCLEIPFTDISPFPAVSDKAVYQLHTYHFIY